MAATMDQVQTLSDQAQSALDRTHLKATPGYYKRSWQRFKQDKLALGSLIVLGVVVVFVFSAPLISLLTGFTPQENHLNAKLTPMFTDGYLLGSDGNGRDILTRLVYGGRISLTIALISTVTTLLIGGGLGLFAGYMGRWWDSILMRFIDVLLSIPALPLLILIATIYSPGPYQLPLVLAAVSWMGIARIVRGDVLRIKATEYIEAARVVGVGGPRIAFKHILPNAMPMLIVFTSLVIPGLIIAEAGLSFLGIGVQVPTPSWGNMMRDGTRYFRGYPEKVLIPGLMIYVTSLLIYMVGSGVRDAFDPRIGDQ